MHTQATSADILQTSISISGVSHSLDANFVAGFGFVSLVSLNYFEKEKKRRAEIAKRKGALVKSIRTWESEMLEQILPGYILSHPWS